MQNEKSGWLEILISILENIANVGNLSNKIPIKILSPK